MHLLTSQVESSVDTDLDLHCFFNQICTHIYVFNAELSLTDDLQF